jgi:anti-sigma regulatory factor (Ser/Thr protein kinase)
LPPCTLSRDFVTAISCMRLHGTLEGIDLPAIAATLSRALLDDPIALVMDLTTVRDAGWRAISVLADAGRLALGDGDTPILVCADLSLSTGPPDSVSAEVALYRSMRDADAAARVLTQRPNRRHRRLPPQPWSVTSTRHMVDAACAAWQIPTVTQPAQAIASELAGNAVRHAATEFDVTLGLLAGHLRISVRDRSTTLPHRSMDAESALTEGGRGLMITEALSTEWGAMPADDGKTVWAIVRT